MPVHQWLHDLRLALRGVRRAKAFYVTAVLTLAIGMAGATVMFTLIRGILLRPLPVPDEDRLVVSWRVPPDGPTHVPYRAGDVEEIWPREPVSSRAWPASATTAPWSRRGTTAAPTFTARTAVVMG